MRFQTRKLCNLRVEYGNWVLDVDWSMEGYMVFEINSLAFRFVVLLSVLLKCYPNGLPDRGIPSIAAVVSVSTSCAF